MANLFIVTAQPDFDISKAIIKIEELLNLKLSFKILKQYDHIAAFTNLEYQESYYQKIKEQIVNGNFDFDVIYQKVAPNFVKPGMLLMDMDMTTVQIEGIDEIARAYGVYDKVAAITHNAMHGHLDFKSSLKERVSLLKGANAMIIEQVKAIMPETTGLGALIKLLQTHQYKIGIASGGFTQLISVIDEKYHLDFIKANTLEVKAGVLTGSVLGEIVDAKAKEQGFFELQSLYHIEDSQTICLGDGANDLLMLSHANLAIAYHGKPKVVKEAQYCFNHSNLYALCIYLEVANGKE